MGAHIRAHDWANNELGEPEYWPQSLRTVVRLMLNTRHPIFIFWGPNSICFYNDAYSASLGPERHPIALGQPGHVVWAEIWNVIGPQIAQVLAGGPPTWFENQLIPITRFGRVEDAYWTYSYSPIDDDGAANGVGGALVLVTETTDHVMSEKAASAETGRFARLFEQAPSFMAVLRGPTHIFDITNAAYLQLIGHRDLIGKPVRDALPEIAGQGFFELLDGVYSTGKAFVGTALPAQIQRRPNAPPEERLIDLIYQPIIDETGATTGIFAQGHDVTDQKLAELAAAASEARFRQLAQSIPNHVWTALPDGNLDWFNDQVYAYSGSAPGDLDGLKWASIVHPEDISSAAATWAAALESGEPYKTEFRLRRRDGVYRWFIARAVANTDVGGARRWVGTNTDIEDEKQVERALRTSEVRVKLALAAAEMGVWGCRIEHGKFVDLEGDERALTLLGGSPGQRATFQEFVSRVHPDDRAKMLAAAAASIDPKGGGLLDIEYRVGERWVHTRAQVVQNGEGVRMVGTVRDVSESKDAEARQALVRSELQHRIKNTLAMVNAIASQTLRGDDIADRRATFNNRLAALAGAHDMLMVTDVRGGDLRSIVERALAPHASHDDRFVIAGPDVALSAKQSLSMALVVHELATNAAKYGALSTSEGGVSITWGHEAGNQPGEPTFNFVWEESGGPRVVEPTRKGFGSRLINRVLSGDFNGTVSIEYAPGGVRCVLQSPPSSVALGASGRMEPAGN
jgi:PAS domain S-box-containing protein